MISDLAGPPTRFIRASRLGLALGAATLAMSAQAEDVFTAAGSSAAAITSAITDFRNALGTLNPNQAGSFGTGRREINWDGVPDNRSAPNLLPADFFNVNSPRGAVFSTPGSGMEVSATAASGTPVQFGNIDAAYPGLFEPFSPQRLFTAVGSNVVDVDFFVAGTTQAALTRGFGAVFSDVDSATSTVLSFFDLSHNPMGTYAVPAAGGNEGFSFLGVDFGTASVARVRITSGNQALAAGTTTEDLVTMDDFIYGEPIPAVPEPGIAALMVAGIGILGAVVRRRRG